MCLLYDFMIDTDATSYVEDNPTAYCLGRSGTKIENILRLALINDTISYILCYQ